MQSCGDRHAPARHDGTVNTGSIMRCTVHQVQVPAPSLPHKHDACRSMNPPNPVCIRLQAPLLLFFRLSAGDESARANVEWVFSGSSMTVCVRTILNQCCGYYPDWCISVPDDPAGRPALEPCPHSRIRQGRRREDAGYRPRAPRWLGVLLSMRIWSSPLFGLPACIASRSAGFLRRNFPAQFLFSQRHPPAAARP